MYKISLKLVAISLLLIQDVNISTSPYRPFYVATEKGAEHNLH